MTMIKPYPVYPPEAVYMREPPTDSPSIVLREKGKARLAYLSGDVDASYWRLDNVDLGRQLLNTLQWILRDGNPVTVKGEGLMEVCAWETEPGFAIHMVNYNGPNAFRGRMRTPVSLGPQQVRLELPRDIKIRNASLLRAEKPVTFRQHGRTIEFTVPLGGDLRGSRAGDINWGVKVRLRSGWQPWYRRRREDETHNGRTTGPY